MIRQGLVILTAAALTTGAATEAKARSGRASYYTHSGAMITAANEPVGSMIRATNPQTGKSILVRVVGSGPFVPGRVLDFSTGAFKALYGGLGRGVGPVSYQVVSRGAGLSSRGGSARKRSKRLRSSRRYRHYRRHR